MKKNIQIEVPVKVRRILERLMAAGYEAYAVGGCVRDSILGRKPNDWDITTSAKPKEVKKLFRPTIDTGIQHGTVTVLMGHEGFEVTTYRVDGAYTDGRHPDSVSFTTSLVEDLRRRDFTINAMAYNPDPRFGFVDAFDGYGDIERKLIRAVGNPYERFEEDALRILRAVRFAAQLGYAIEPETHAALAAFAPHLSAVSIERITVELTKLLLSAHPEKLDVLRETGILKEILPEVWEGYGLADSGEAVEEAGARHAEAKAADETAADKGAASDEIVSSISRWQRMLEELASTDAGQLSSRDCRVLRYSLLLAPLGADGAYKVLRRLRLDNDTCDTVRKLVEIGEIPVEESAEAMRRTMCQAGKEMMELLFFYRLAKIDGELREEYKDILADGMSEEDREIPEKADPAGGEKLWKAFYLKKQMEELETAKYLYEGVLERGECTCLAELAVTGNDLIAAGVPKGREIGKTLAFLLDLVLKDPEKNQKDVLIGLISATKDQGF